MTRGKAINFQSSECFLRGMMAAALTIIFLLFASYSIALGQTLDSEYLPLPDSAISVIEAAELPNISPSVSEPSLAADSITLFDESDFLQTLPVEQAFDQELIAPASEEFLCDSQPAPQHVRLVKSVIGCKANYTVLPQDEIWILSVRDSFCDPGNVGLFKVKKLENSNWQESSLDALTDAHLRDTSRKTMMYVHGNNTDYEYGVARGFQFYDNLFVRNDCPRPPVRLVLWLWKSERELARLYPDYLVKSRRSVQMGKAMTKTLEAFSNCKLAIVGFSLGVQVVLSSLEELEHSPNCPTVRSPNEKYQIALIASAIDPAYICDVIDRNVESSIAGMTSIISNRDDRSVKAMRLVLRKECPEANDTFSKLARDKKFPLGPLEFHEVSREVRGRHAVGRYTKAPTTQRVITQMLNRVAGGSH